ncbi:lipase family protein (macronuclear) [Tetrahymena thermophila SB210]|uniref:Lipase family protein n=1 Tax=Tetrahymena thermophila (strain SB210) TaxID=312017 RepID=Q237S1_TETTS|nr:lipase family protein [Tetrahymena thermophila SB210]EAR92670.1 lipase family protein [Tetrahymena thermophila SB210]|eukprot:XP_001012915.1 lipase family protein [Tetrahymena thermophila SB210]
MKIVLTILILITLSSCQIFTYNEQLAQKLAAFSLASYCTSNYLSNWNCGFACQQNQQGLQNLQILTNTTSYATALIGYSPDLNGIVISFRGTTSAHIQTYITDLKLYKTQYPLCKNCQVHAGFYSSYQDIQQQLISSFKNLRQLYPQALVFVTGHSLGAALGALSLPDIFLLNNNQKINAFYNFGSPRVGNQDYAIWFNTQNFANEYARVTNGADPVPENPAEWIYYRHYNHEVYYPNVSQNPNQFVKCYYAEDNNCEDRIFLATNINDHLGYYGWNWTQATSGCE